MAISPDGTRLLAGRSDSSVGVYDLRNEARLRTLRRHGGPVWSVAWLSDGRLALFGGTNEHSVFLWDTTTGESCWHRRGLDRIDSLAVSPDEGRVAMTEFMNIVVRDLSSGEQLACLDGGKVRVQNVVWTKTGRIVVADGFVSIKVWDPDARRVLRTLRVDDFFLSGFSLAPDERKAILSGVNTMVLLDMASGKELRRWENLKGQVKVAFSPVGDKVLSGEKWGNVRLWDLSH